MSLKTTIRRVLTPPSTNYLYRKIDPSPYDLLPPNPVIFDIGSKEARGHYAFGAPPPGAKIVCVDLFEGPGVDLVADAHDMHMVSDNSVDCVVTISALEHVRDPQKVVEEIFRILKPGGVIYVSVPFIFAFHADPDDYYRFLFHGVKILCKQFQIVDSGFNRGPASLMCDLLVRFFSILFSFNSMFLFNVNRTIFGWLLFWVKYLDAVIAHYKMAYVVHDGVYLIGRKPQSSKI